MCTYHRSNLPPPSHFWRIPLRQKPAFRSWGAAFDGATPGEPLMPRRCLTEVLIRSWHIHTEPDLHAALSGSCADSM